MPPDQAAVRPSLSQEINGSGQRPDRASQIAVMADPAIAEVTLAEHAWQGPHVAQGLKACFYQSVAVEYTMAAAFAIQYNEIED